MAPMRLNPLKVRLIVGTEPIARKNAAADFIPLQLARGGAGEFVLPDVIAEDSLACGQLSRQSFDVKPDHVPQVDDLTFTRRLVIRDNHRV